MLIPQPKITISKRPHNQKLLTKAKKFSLNQLQDIFHEETTEIKSFVETSTPQPKQKAPRRKWPSYKSIEKTTFKKQKQKNTFACKHRAAHTPEEPNSYQGVHALPPLLIKDILNPVSLQQPCQAHENLCQNQYLDSNFHVLEAKCSNFIPISSSYKPPHNTFTRSYTCKSFSAAENHQSKPIHSDSENEYASTHKLPVNIPSIDELRRNIYLKKCSLNYILNPKRTAIDLSSNMQLSTTAPCYSVSSCSFDHELFSFSDKLSENISTLTNSDGKEQDYTLNDISSYINGTSVRMSSLANGNTNNKNDWLNQIKHVCNLHPPANSNDPLDLLCYDKYMIILK